MSHGGGTYCYADVGRSGLGNMLIPWARCEIFRARSGAAMLAPQWTQPKIGPVLRRERDKRYYVGLFKHDGYVRGLRRALLLLTAPRATEAEPPPRDVDAGRALHVFRGLQGMFEPLLAHRELVRERLGAILSDRVRERLAAASRDEFVIGVHARRGDKQTLAFRQPLAGSHQTLPDEWYVNCVANVRRLLGRDAPVRVFSDARPGELGKVLALPNVTLAGRNPSIVDLLLMARSRVLVATGLSTFSMWAAFLGQMPSLWYPGSLARLNPEVPGLESETDLEGNVGDAFAELISNPPPRPAVASASL